MSQPPPHPDNHRSSRVTPAAGAGGATGATGAPASTPALAELADELGIDTSYVNVTGDTITASDQSLLSIMRALGVDIESVDGATAARDKHRARLARQLIDAVHVVYDGESVPLRVTSQPVGAMKLTLTLDDGTKRTLDEPTLPAGLPFGYHDVTISVAGQKPATSRIISAPKLAHRGRHPRTWGLFAPLYSLRSTHDWGIGDLGDMRDLLEIVGEDGGGLVGSTPLLATFLESPFEPSPYAPVSRLFWNEEYVELEQIAEFRTPQVAALVRDPEIEQTRQALCATTHVDHRAVYALKRTLLEACATELFDRGGPRLKAFEQWRDHEGGKLLLRYAGFRAAIERDGLRPDRDAKLPIDSPEARYHLYVQWCMAEQLAALGDGEARAGLYLDLPLGVHPDGFDMWEWQHLFAPGMSVGAPPDPLALGGQDWGLPPLHPQLLREDGYRYTIACIQHLFRHAATVRIDHVMGLHRLFWVPSELETSEGVYVRYCADEQWAIVCLESHRRGAQVVGEDLGTVPAAVREAMTEHQARRSYVLQFELTLDGKMGAPAFSPAPAGSLATLNTHDTPTWAAVWAGLDTKARTKFIEYVAPEIGTNAIKIVTSTTPQAAAAAASYVLAAGDADAVIFNLEDLWGELEPQNVPGTTSQEAPNWQRKALRPIEEIRAADQWRSMFRALTTARMKDTDTNMTPPGKQTTGPRVRHDVSLLTPDDIHLFNEGTHNKLHHKLGA
ncbi:MAG: 4-alpha-glucanotransferase, partial [Thermoleophilia bacterium]|nr:4-alpha-glucanotransferase [Thermoleophilia bacterium]